MSRRRPVLPKMEFLTELQPVLTSMSLLGLYHNPCLSNSPQSAQAENQAGHGQTTSNPSGRRNQDGWTVRGSKYYCLMVCCLTWFQPLRFLPSFWVGVEHQEHVLSTRILTLMWYLQCALNTVIIYRGCTKSNQLQNFFTMLKDDYQRHLFYSPPPEQVSKLKKKMTAFTVIAWILFILNSLVGVLYMLELNETSAGYTSVFTDPFGTSVPSKVFAGFLFATSSSAWVFPVLFIGGFCSFLILRFKTLNQNLRAAISRCKGALPPEIELYRRQHTHLCTWVRKLDNLLQLLFIASYATSIPLMCFMMYQLVIFSANVFELVSLVFWIVGNVGCVSVVSVWAALVHEEAHSPVDYLYEVNTAGATQEQAMQLQLFVSRVTGTSVGFTALGIVTITKEMILTLGGILVTYFVLLLQQQIN